MPARQPPPQPSHGGSAGFTTRETALLEAVMHAVGTGLLEERQKAHDLRRVEDELRYLITRRVDKAMATLRGEILTERLAVERELRAQDQRYYRASTGSGGQPAREIIGEMIELN